MWYIFSADPFHRTLFRCRIRCWAPSFLRGYNCPHPVTSHDWGVTPSLLLSPCRTTKTTHQPPRGKANSTLPTEAFTKERRPISSCSKSSSGKTQNNNNNHNHNNNNNHNNNHNNNNNTHNNHNKNNKNNNNNNHNNNNNNNHNNNNNNHNNNNNTHNNHNKNNKNNNNNNNTHNGCSGPLTGYFLFLWTQWLVWVPKPYMTMTLEDVWGVTEAYELCCLGPNRDLPIRCTWVHTII